MRDETLINVGKSLLLKGEYPEGRDEVSRIDLIIQRVLYKYIIYCSGTEASLPLNPSSYIVPSHPF